MRVTEGNAWLSPPLHGNDVANISDEAKGVKIPEVVKGELAYVTCFGDLPPAVGR